MCQKSNAFDVVILKVALEDYLMENQCIVKFLNLKSTDILKPDGYGHSIYINAEHKFIHLLLCVGKNLYEISDLLKEFFEKLNDIAKADNDDDKEKLFNQIVSIQRQILEWLAEKRYIEKDEIEKYILTKNDFPDYIFKS